MRAILYRLIHWENDDVSPGVFLRKAVFTQGIYVYFIFVKSRQKDFLASVKSQEEILSWEASWRVLF